MSLNKQDDIGKIINSIRGINYSLQRQSKELMKSFKITGPQMGALRILSQYPDISLKDLSDRMYLHVSTVCGIVDRLEKAGHLKRNRNNEDRRAININLTEKGRKTVKEAPLSGFANMFRDLQKLPSSEIHRISIALVHLSKLMDIEINDLKSIS
jgi:MarR family transcriptional regulator, organic hydroperoxide resistance regulator